MTLLKRLGRNNFVLGLAARAVAFYIRFLGLTARWRVIGLEAPLASVEGGQPIIGAFWHGRMVMMPQLWRRYGGARFDLRMLISRHRDGQMIARTIAHLGFATIAGSSSRGGARALREIIEAVAQGASIGITPDGPRGPRMRASAGVAGAGRLTGAPVFAISFSASRRRVMKSWDRFVLPKPFARIVVVIKGPIQVGPEEGPEALERARLAIEDALNEATREADRLCGWPPIEPAPVGARPRGYHPAPEPPPDTGTDTGTGA
ncbi:MAG: lysophospholipid acyltransferase family protein [Alphaproteobacteria bacterium]